MKLIRRLVIVSFLILIIGAGWLWWNLPKKVDMAAYAPADSFVYLEANSLTEIAAALERNDTWKALGPILGTPSNSQNHWLSASQGGNWARRKCDSRSCTDRACDRGYEHK